MVADHQPGDDRRDDPRLVDPVGHEVRPVGGERQRQLDEVVVDDRDEPREDEPDARPITVLITTVVTTDTMAPLGVTSPTTAPSATVKMTIAVPSLNRLSLSISVARRRGEPAA